MSKKISIMSVFVLLTLSSSFGQRVGEDILFSNFLKVMNYGYGTINSYVVINVKYTKTRQKKEICTKPDFLRGAIHKEYNLDYDEVGTKMVEKIIQSKKDRTFSFQKEEAIYNLGVGRYSEKDLAKIERENNFNAILDSIRINKKWKYESFDGRVCYMYAHLLLNRGVITKSNSCYFNGLWAVIE